MPSLTVETGGECGPSTATTWCPSFHGCVPHKVAVGVSNHEAGPVQADGVDQEVHSIGDASALTPGDRENRITIPEFPVVQLLRDTPLRARQMESPASGALDLEAHGARGVARP